MEGEIRMYARVVGVLVAVMLVIGLPVSAEAAPFAYITNYNDDTVTVIDAADFSVRTTIPVGYNPFGVAVAPGGEKVYVVNRGMGRPASVSVIDGVNHTVIATHDLPGCRYAPGVAVKWSTPLSPSKRLYIACWGTDLVRVLDLAADGVGVTGTTDIPMGGVPWGVAVHPYQHYPAQIRVYATVNRPGYDDPVVVIDENNNIVKEIPLDPRCNPEGIAFDRNQPSGFLYVTCAGGGIGYPGVYMITNDYVNDYIPQWEDSWPAGVAVGPSGDIWTTKWGTGEIARFGPTTMSFDPPYHYDDPPGDILVAEPPPGYLQGLAVDWRDYVWVPTGQVPGLVKIYNSNGTELDAIPVGDMPQSFGIFIDQDPPCIGVCCPPHTGPCNDRNACTTGDTCNGQGACIGTPISCDDGNLCTEDSCDARSGCSNVPVFTGSSCDDGNPCTSYDVCAGGVCAGVAEPEPTCRETPRGFIKIQDLSPDSRDRFGWLWSKGSATAMSDFGDPTNGTTDYTLCVYDENAGESSVVMSAQVPAGGSCGSRPCWRVAGSYLRYTDREGLADGITTMKLRAGADGRAKILIKGKGENLLLPVLPLMQDHQVVIQLSNSDGVCWGASYLTPAHRNDTVQFKDRRR